MAGSHATIGNAAGEVIYSFTAAADSGPLLYYVSPPGIYPNNYSLIRCFREFTLGLTGDGAGLAITAFFTTDLATANGTSAVPAWFLCPSPSTESSTQWSNPMVNAIGLNVLNFKPNAIALRFVSAPIVGGPPITGTTNVILMAS